MTYGTLATFAGLAGIYFGNPPPDASKHTCGGATCAYYAAESGAYGLNNTVTPAFTGYSITDQWNPSDKLNFNFGLRVDNYSFVGSNTNTGPARDFWFNAFNQDTCYDTATLGLVDRSALMPFGTWSTNSQKPCSSFGKQYVNANIQNTPTNWDYNIVQPRIGMTYTVNPDTVLRASYGKYNEQPSSAYEQYNGLEQNLPDTLSAVLLPRIHDAGPCGGAFDLVQQRLLAGASLQGHRYVVQALALLAPDAEPGRELLHQLRDRHSPPDSTPAIKRRAASSSSSTRAISPRTESRAKFRSRTRTST